MYCAAVGDTFVNSSHTPLLQITKVVSFPIRNTASSSNRGSYFRSIVEPICFTTIHVAKDSW